MARRQTLRSLFDNHNHYGADKWTSYFDAYDNYFAKYRDKPVSLLEIGVQNGGSLEIWAKYFPKAVRIVGCDIDEKCSTLNFSDDRISVKIGDANSQTVYQQIVRDTPNFDIIIDDGSHIVGDVIRSFSLYFPRVSPGGMYVIEDLHTSYWPELGGGTDLTLSSMTFLKLLTDVVNKQFWRDNGANFNLLEPFAKKYQAELYDADLDIEEVAFRNSICFISKASNNNENRRHITGKNFSVMDYSNIVSLSGQPELLDRIGVRNRLRQSTEMQQEYVKMLPVILSNHAELTELRTERHDVRQRFENKERELEQTLHSIRCELQQILQALHDESDKVHVLRNELERRTQELQLSDEALGDAKAYVKSLLSSSSWRLTSPFRFCATLALKAKARFGR